jgi:hypothetical protein
MLSILVKGKNKGGSLSPSPAQRATCTATWLRPSLPLSAWSSRGNPVGAMARQSPRSFTGQTLTRLPSMNVLTLFPDDKTTALLVCLELSSRSLLTTGEANHNSSRIFNHLHFFPYRLLGAGTSCHCIRKRRMARFQVQSNCACEPFRVYDCP